MKCIVRVYSIIAALCRDREYFVDDKLEDWRDVHADDVPAVEGELRGASFAIVHRLERLLDHESGSQSESAPAFEAQRGTHLVVELRARRRTAQWAAERTANILAQRTRTYSCS